MLTFLKYLLKEDTGTHLVTSFMRMNPPTGDLGHGKVIKQIKKIAQQQNAAHQIVLSHSQDKKKNPLTSEQKLKHVKRMYPDTNFSVASKEKPTIFHHLSNAYDAGHRHVTIVVGGDRLEGFKKMVSDQNGRAGPHGYYKFKSLNFVSAGDRDPDADAEHGGVSATKKRQMVHDNDFESYAADMPKHMSLAHKKEQFNDVRKGLGYND